MKKSTKKIENQKSKDFSVFKIVSRKCIPIFIVIREKPLYDQFTNFFRHFRHFSVFDTVFGALSLISCTKILPDLGIFEKSPTSKCCNFFFCERILKIFGFLKSSIHVLSIPALFTDGRNFEVRSVAPSKFRISEIWNWEPPPEEP